MVKLEIRNLESSKSHLIDPGGAIIGREGGDAQIKLPDQGVSKKHARIYAKRGTWYLEDLDSANGTYLEDERITSAVTLAPGAVFTMSRQQFEVVQIVTEEPEATRAPRDEEDAAETNAMEPGELPDRGLRGSKGGHRRGGAAGRSNAELRRGQRLEEEPPPTDHSTSARVHTDPESEMDESASAEPQPRGRGRGQNNHAGGAVMSASRAREEDSEVPAPSFAYFASAIPRAIGYYLKTVPLMGLNPLGTIKKGIAEQPLPALSYLELIAYSIPAQLAVALVNAVCVAIVSLVAGNFSPMVLLPIVPLIIAVVSAAIGGFIAHPVLTWIVDKLEGQSDARSRSNFFVMVQTVTILMALPTALATLLSLAARVPFINLLPPLLSLVSTLVMVYLAFSWFRYFGVVQWFEYALLGLGLLACLATAWGLVGAIGASVRSFGSGGTTVATGSTAGGDAAEVMAAAEKRAAELAAAGDSAGAARVMQEAAVAASKGPASPNPEAPPPNPTSAANPPPNTPPAPETTPTTTAAANPAPTSPDPPPVPTAAVTPPAPTPPPPAPPPEVKPASGRSGKLSYPDYRAQRDAIDRAIAEDPTVLRQSSVLAGYERLLKETKAAEAKFKPRDPKEPHMSQINARLKDVAVYDATADAVSDLYARMFKR